MEASFLERHVCVRIVQSSLLVRRFGGVESVRVLPKRSSDGGRASFVDFMDIKSAVKAHEAAHKMGSRELRTNYNEPGAKFSFGKHVRGGGISRHRYERREGYFRPLCWCCVCGSIRGIAWGLWYVCIVSPLLWVEFVWTVEYALYEGRGMELVALVHRFEDPVRRSGCGARLYLCIDLVLCMMMSDG